MHVSPQPPAQIQVLKPELPAAKSPAVSAQQLGLEADQLKVSQPGTVQFDVLSLNTFGLPKPLGKDVGERHSRIGKAIGSYEVVGFQEAFSSESKNLAAGAALTGLSYHIHQPSEQRLLTSGLATFSQYEIVKSGFKAFSYGSHADALAEKGVSFSRIRVPGGGLIDVYNTHFQAANDHPRSKLDQLWFKGMAQIFPGYDMPRNEIRAHDAQVLIDYVKANDEGHPVIIMGDFNTQDHQPVYQQLRQGLGLHDSFREANPTDPGYTSDALTNPYKDGTDKRKRVDYIFYRSGQDAELKVLSSELAFNQAVDGMFVSDHYGLHTQFQLTAKAAAEKPLAGR